MGTGLYYLGALQAGILMSRAMGEDPALYEGLIAKGKAVMSPNCSMANTFIRTSAANMCARTISTK